MPWINPCFIYHFHVGERVAIPERGQGRVVEVLERVRDCDGNWRTPYRVELDTGGEFLAHPDNMRPVEATKKQRKDSRMNDVLQQAIDQYDPTHIIAMFSGGHDSLVATHTAMQHPRFSFAAHMNTGIGIEQTRQFVRDTCESWGIELREYHAAECVRADGMPDPQAYEDIVLEHGFPGPAQHQKMYIRLKERPLAMMIRDLDRGRMDRVLLVTGVRSDESERRIAHVKPIQKWGSKIWVAPIWDWDKRQCNEYIAAHGLKRNWVSDILHMSGECLCGAYAHEGELDEVRTWFPETAAEIERIQARVTQRFPWGWEDGPPSWWQEHKNGQEFIPGMEPQILCTGCTIRDSKPEAT